MENQPPSDLGAHPPTPPLLPTEPPDQGVQQNVETPNEDEFHEAMSEGSFEEEPPSSGAQGGQSTTAKNGVSKPSKFADNLAKGLEKTSKSNPEDLVLNKKFLKKKEQDRVPGAETPTEEQTTTQNGVSPTGRSARKHAKNLERTEKNDPKDVTPNTKPPKNTGRDQPSRSANKKPGNPGSQTAAEEQTEKTASKQHDVSELIEAIRLVEKNANKQHDIKELIEAIKILAQEQHVDNQKIESRVEENGQMIKEIFADKEKIESRSEENGQSIKTLTEEVKKCTRSMADFTRLGVRFDEFLKSNQSPTVRKDSKRQKRVRDQSPQSESTDLEREQTTAPATAAQTVPPMGAAHVTPNAAPPGTILKNGNLAATVVGPKGTTILKRPGYVKPGPGTTSTAPPGTAPRPVNSGPNGQRQNQESISNLNGARRNQHSYAGAASNIPGPIPPHPQNNRGTNQSLGNGFPKPNKQPTFVKNDHFEVCPDTGNVRKVEAFKTVPFRSDKQKGRENKRHSKNLQDVMKELVLFNIPTRDANGTIMTKEQDIARVVKVLRELKRTGYTLKQGDITSTVRQWKNTRHPDFIPITITFSSEDIRTHVTEAALEAQIVGARTPRNGDQEYDRIGYLRKSLTERERKELRIRREKRNSPEGMAFAEIRKREENSRADEDDWANFPLEEEEVPIHMEPAGGNIDDPFREPNNNENNQAEAIQDMMLKMQDMQEHMDRLKADHAAANAAKEDADSDFELMDHMRPYRGPSKTAPNMFSCHSFEQTQHLDLNNPNLREIPIPRSSQSRNPPPQDKDQDQMAQSTPTPEGGETTDSECEYI